MTRYMLSEAERAAEIARWNAYREILTHCLAQHALIFDAIRTQVQPLWETLTAGKTFPRKPSYSLRLFAEDKQTLVGISPLYTRQTRSVDCSRLVVEMISDVARYLSAVDPTPYYQLKRQLTLGIRAGLSPQLMRYSFSAVEDVAALVPTLEQFLQDPASVLRRSTTYCAICGRHLTDGQSRARGIGPECLRHMSTLRTSVEPILSLVFATAEAEETATYA